MLNDETFQEPVYKDIYARHAAPLHPGEVLRDDLLPASGLSKTGLAKRIGIGPRRLNKLLTEQTPITADLAIRLGALFGHGPRYWLGLQMQFDLWLTDQPTTSSIKPLQWKRPPCSATQTNLLPLKVAIKMANKANAMVR